MNTIKDLISALLLLLPGGAAARAVICIIKIQMDSEQASTYKRRLINLLIFTVVAECIVGLLYVVMAYLGIYGGDSGHF